MICLLEHLCVCVSSAAIGRIVANLDIGDIKICRKIPNLVKINQNYRSPFIIELSNLYC